MEHLPCVIPFKPQAKNYDLTWKYFRKIPKANPKHTHNTTDATMKKWGAFTLINPHLNLRPKNMSDLAQIRKVVGSSNPKLTHQHYKRGRQEKGL